MSEYKTLIVEKDSFVAIISINRPASLNALNSEVLSELKAAALKLDDDKDVKAVIITGNSEKSFVAGADISEMVSKDVSGARAFAVGGHQAFSAIEQLKKPVIAAVNGFALGGGCELAMACDIRIAAQKAKFGQPEVNLGVIPGFGGTQRLTKLVGMGMAKLLIMSARTIDAAEALRIGLADMVVPNDQLMAEAKKLAMEIAGKSSNAVRIAKETINMGYEMDYKASLDFEAAKFGECYYSPEQKEGMTAFLEKRPAKF